jgi:hypothetical protein
VLLLLCGDCGDGAAAVLFGLYAVASARYKPSEIVITENGVSAPKEQLMTTAEAIRDSFRVNFYNGYLDNVCKAINEGINVVTYFAWSFMDNFEVWLISPGAVHWQYIGSRNTFYCCWSCSKALTRRPLLMLSLAYLLHAGSFKRN